MDAAVTSHTPRPVLRPVARNMWRRFMGPWAPGVVVVVLDRLGALALVYWRATGVRVICGGVLGVSLQALAPTLGTNYYCVCDTGYTGANCDVYASRARPHASTPAASALLGSWPHGVAKAALTCAGLVHPLLCPLLVL